MNYPKLYVFDGFLVKGEMGGLTDLEIKEACDVCHRKDIIYHRLSYKFDQWDGEDIVKGARFHLFSQRMKDAFEKENIEGIGFEIIENERSEYFKIGKNAYQKELPIFYRILIHNKLDGPEIWYKKAEICEKCNDQKWDYTIEGVSSMITSNPNEVYTTREVYKNTWNGEGLFLLQDPAPPVITEDLFNVIRNSTNQTLELREANWA